MINKNYPSIDLHEIKREMNLSITSVTEDEYEIIEKEIENEIKSTEEYISSEYHL